MLLEYLLVSYFDIVRKNIRDLVPKSIAHFLINEMKRSMQQEIIQVLYKEERLQELLQESPLVAEQREKYRREVEMLKKAHEILNEVRDFHL